MRRGLALCLGPFAVAAGCTAFATNQTTPGATTGDGGVTLDADSAPPTRDGGAKPGPCPPQISDDFARNDVLAAPWQKVLTPDPAQVKIVGGALEIGTIVSAGPVKYMLTTGTFAAPKQLACSFDFTGRSDFTSENGQPIELLVLVLTAADRTSTLLHFGYFDTRIWLQEEHLDAEGKSCTSCNNNQDSLVLEIPKNETAKLNVVVQGDVTTFTRNTDAVSRPFGLSSAVSAEILFGLWSFSPYGQQADLDNFQCSLTCP